MNMNMNMNMNMGCCNCKRPRPDESSPFDRAHVRMPQISVAIPGSHSPSTRPIKAMPCKYRQLNDPFQLLSNKDSRVYRQMSSCQHIIHIYFGPLLHVMCRCNLYVASVRCGESICPKPKSLLWRKYLWKIMWPVSFIGSDLVWNLMPAKISAMSVQL